MTSADEQRRALKQLEDLNTLKNFQILQQRVQDAFQPLVDALDKTKQKTLPGFDAALEEVPTEVEDAVGIILDHFVPRWREDPNFEGTPDRVARAMYDYWFAGYEQTIEDVMTVFPNIHDERAMVVVKDIPFYSTCAHHMAPFFGKAAIVYLPKNQVAGLSKFARAVEVHARRFQLQEHITRDVAFDLMNILDPHGVMVVLYDVEHTCMTSRGVQAHGSTTSTSMVLGCFASDPVVRQEALSLIFGR